MSDRGILSSLRYLLADFIGEDDDTPPLLPEGLPEPVMAVASDAIHLLIDYQGTGYAQLYVDRLRRFVGRNGVDDVMLTEIARLMAARMSYEDLIRIAQLKLAGLADRSRTQARSVDVRKFRLDELVSVLPAIIAAEDRSGIAPVATVLGALRQGTGLGQRWLHMIDRSLTRQPEAASEIVQTAAMIRGYGDVYRQGMADWNAIIDGLAKPAFDGVLALPDLAGAVADARAAALPDPQQAALKRRIAEIRARVHSDANAAAG